MKILRKLTALLLIICAAASGIVASADGTVKLYRDSVTVTETSSGGLERKIYTASGADTVEMVSYASSSPGRTVALATLSGGEGGTIRYYSAEADRWVTEPLENGEYSASFVYITLGGSYYAVYLPVSWRPLGAGSRELLPEYGGTIRVETGNGRTVARVTVKSPPAGCVSEYMCARSSKPLIDWQAGAEYWAGLRLDGDSRWCIDGYYRPSPSGYSFSGENVYFRCPAAYFLTSLAAGAEVHRAAELLMLAAADVLAGEQNDNGYWPTEPEVATLAKYGIGGGYYDTRWNSDLVATLAEVYKRYGGQKLRGVLTAYAEFYASFASEHRSLTANGGWLVPDYYGDGETSEPHTSLNHQLAEITALYRLSDALGDAALASLADRLLLGVSDTAQSWIKPDGDLYYAVDRSGVYSGDDYPTLTYNDLVSLKELLTDMDRNVPDGVNALIESKRAWIK